MLGCSSFWDNLRWNKQVFLVVKIRLFAKCPSREQSKRSHAVWGCQHPLCEENSNSHHLGVWLLLETKGTTAARHHTGIYTGCFSWLWGAPTKKAALTTFCSLGWHQWVYTLLAQVLAWQRQICPWLLTFNLSPPAHNSLKAVFCSISAPSLEFTFCQLMMDGWMDGGEINVSPQTSNFCPKWSEMELVWWQTCRCTIFLPLIWGKFCDVREVSLSIKKSPFVLNDRALLRDSHLTQDFGYWGLGEQFYIDRETFWHLYKQSKR